MLRIGIEEVFGSFGNVDGKRLKMVRIEGKEESGGGMWSLRKGLEGFFLEVTTFFSKKK